MQAPAPPPRKQSRNPSRLPRPLKANEAEEEEKGSHDEGHTEYNGDAEGELDGEAEERNPESPVKTKGVLAAQRRARRERDADLPVFKDGYDLLMEEPDMIISEHVKIKGDLKFEKLLRIDGTVTGHVQAPRTAGLIVGRDGTLVGNVRGLGCLLVEGKIIGNVNAESVLLTETGIIHGDIAARSIDVKPNGRISGQMHISAFDPFAALEPETGKIEPTKKSSKFFATDVDATIEDDEDAIAYYKRRSMAVADHEDWSDDDEGGKKPKPRVALFIIDPQVDFHSTGTCPIPGADEDAEIISEFILQNMRKIEEIYVTLDSHHRMHIAHSIFWENNAGERPPLYTVIRLRDLEEGVWTPRDASLVNHCKYYLRELEMDGRGINLVIKPEHALIGSEGHYVVPTINDALQEWARSRMRKISYIFKGTNCLTDMTSAISGDVEIPDDPTTSIDLNLIQRLEYCQKVLICGQSLSHGINFTVRDLLSRWRKEPSVINILNDCTSPNIDLNPTFDVEKYYKEMRKAGVTVVPSYEALLDGKKKKKKKKKKAEE